MAWKSLSKEGIGLLASILLQVYAMIKDQQLDVSSKVLVIILFVIFSGFLMYTPKKGGKK